MRNAKRLFMCLILLIIGLSTNALSLLNPSDYNYSNNHFAVIGIQSPVSKLNPDEVVQYYEHPDLHLFFKLNTLTKEAEVYNPDGLGMSALRYPTLDTGELDLTWYWSEIDLPSTISYEGQTYTVTSIGSYAFNKLTGIKEVKLPETIEYIGDYAFYWCVGLEKINIPNRVRYIGSNAFEWCHKIKRIHLPEGLPAIGSGVFSDCESLEEINIPGSCKSVGNEAFKWCKKLHKVIVEDGVDTLEFGYNYNVGVNYYPTMEDQIDAKPHYRGQFADSKLDTLYLGRNIIFPTEYNIYINKGLKVCLPFEHCSEYNYYHNRYYYNVNQYKSLEFGEFVTYIPDDLFNGGDYGSGYTGCYFSALPPNVQKIGNRAFKSCSTRKLTLPSTLQYIGDEAFFECPIQELIIEDGVKTIGEKTFYGNNLREFTIPASVQFIGENAFGGAPNLSQEYKNHLRKVNCHSVTPPSEKRPFGDCAVYVPAGTGNAYRTQWGGLIIDSSDEIISVNVRKEGTLYSRLLALDVQKEMVYKLQLKGTLNDDDVAVLVDMPSLYYLDLDGTTMKELPNIFLKEKTNLQNIKLPANLTKIQDNEFNGCIYLTGDIHIPSTCVIIGDSAFYNTAVSGITLDGSIYIGKDAFNKCTNLKEMIELKIQPESIIEENAFYSTGIQKVSIGAGSIIKKHGLNTGGLIDVTIANGVKQISDFSLGNMLERITFEGMIDYIGDICGYCISEVYAPNIETWCNLPFLDAGPMKYSAPHLYIADKEVKDVIIPEKLQTIRKYAFYNCHSLQSVCLPKGIKKINESAFEKCVNLTQVNFPITLTTIETRAFKDCANLSKISLSSSISDIGDYAFAGCPIDSVVLPSSIVHVNEGCFQNCTQLSQLTFSATTQSIGEKAFSGCSALSVIDFPLSVIAISNEAFADCVNLRKIVAHWDIPFTLLGNEFSNLPSDAVLYMPIGTSTTYHKAGWSFFPNLKETGILYATVNKGGTLTYEKETISNRKIDFCFVPYKSFTVYLEPQEGYIIKKVILNGVNITSEVENNTLLFDDPDENLDLSVIFGNPNIVLGDVNGDGVVNSADVINIASYILKKAPDNFIDYVGDLNDDNVINVTDAITVIQSYLKNTTEE